MAEYEESCAEGFVCGREEEKVFPRNHSFGSGATRKAFKKIREFSVTKTNESSLCALYRFRALITLAVVCFLDIAGDTLVPDQTHPYDQNANSEVANATAL